MTAVLSGLQTDTQLQTLSRILTISPEPVTDATTIYVTSTDTRASSSTFISSQITDVPSSISSEPTVSSSASSTSDRSSAKPAGANAGIGIGASLGVLLLGALVVYITILLRRSKKASRENAAAGPAIPPPGIPELGSEGQKYELMGDKAWRKASPVGPDGRTHAHELET
ncbi:hypothetical protein CDV55_100564 [Aspergillus turcosus]|uniref:Mid2 domain-containing protein n=1 Tax=Aspergillus turcosus TaxID=1245748 RepID=A0A229XNJ2_9EURO|nr:hypothetical protein CDV55_100564 [Aspergillus turcosus]RLM01677.1 hypothetical protein CFD26_108758 [Aspergillus turcosus]